ncbi:MAG TPA: helix-turn-helix domain-containing protein, partial [Acidimicrobiia bacterium]|nr:helix-turn-helix domain-containing protein [Acidimicrobiia bacterium]
ALALLVSAGRPLSVADLAEALAVHPNAVRHHLGRFVRQGVVEESVEPATGPGRPRKLFSVTSEATAGPAGVYERLALALLEARRSDRSLLVCGREVAPLVDVDGREPLEAILDTLRADGFEPRLEERGGPDGEIAVVFDRCALERVVALHPSPVCLAHRGVIEGLVARVGGLRVAHLEARDPRAGGCRLLLRLDPAVPPEAPT